MKLSRIGAFIIGFCSLFPLSVLAADIAAGKSKAVSCVSCHGVDGNSTNGLWPKLAGQHASYLHKQMQAFKEGTRTDEIMMSGMVANLSTEDMADIAAYFESQTIKPGNFDQNLLAQGEIIYRGGITEISVPACIACHSPDASGNGPASFPALRTQHPEYIIAQLKKFKAGSRTNDPGKMMRNVAARMSESEMAAVAAYLAGIQ